jgi:hypothetical protein
MRKGHFEEGGLPFLLFGLFFTAHFSAVISRTVPQEFN